MLAVLSVIPAAWRRRWPAAVLAVTVTSGAVTTALNTSPDPALAVAFVMYLIPLRFARRDALRMLAGALLVTPAGVAVFAFTRHGVYGTGGGGHRGRPVRGERAHRRGRVDDR